MHTHTTQCKSVGVVCSQAGECCSDRCELNSLGDRVCQPGSGCKGEGEACTTASQCCSLSCQGGVCATGSLCAPQGGACTTATDCCTNDCDTGLGVCQDTAAPCDTLGASCNQDGNCCSGRCDPVAPGDLRCLPIGPCASAGDVCGGDDDCCNGICDQGLCAALGSCTTVYEPCSGGGECCSGICGDPGTGYPVCLYVGGCTPMKELCSDNSDCCSGSCISDDGGLSMRCEDPPGCLDDGELCGFASSNNCCSEGSSACLPTAIGVTRCWGSSTECIPVTGACSFSDECCEGVCAPDPNAGGELRCNPTCVSDGQACTADADCCNLSCVDGICGPPEVTCIPLGGPCTVNEECCDGICDQSAHICGIIVN